MTYEKLSRGIRYYYDKNIIVKCPARLVLEGSKQLVFCVDKTKDLLYLALIIILVSLNLLETVSALRIAASYITDAMSIST